MVFFSSNVKNETTTSVVLSTRFLLLQTVVYYTIIPVFLFFFAKSCFGIKSEPSRNTSYASWVNPGVSPLKPVTTRAD